MSVRIKTRLTVLFAAAIMLGLSATGPAQAATCRDIKTVQSSADPDKNTAAGGHMTQHILGMAPPSGLSQIDKSLFSDKGKAQAAWRQYGYISNPVNCGGGSAQSQSVSVEKLGMGKIDSLSCTKVDANKKCIEWKSYMAKSIFFGFVLKNNNWILNTMYPEPLTE